MNFFPCVCLSDLQNVDRLGVLTGTPRTAAQLVLDAPTLELGVHAPARDRSCACPLLASFCDCGLFFSLYGTEADAKSMAEAVMGWREAGLTVRSVRGHKMRTVRDLFNEMSAALQFPYYFGENWPAFDECLDDMDWLPMNLGIVIIVYDALEVLDDAADAELAVLVRSIEAARNSYS